MAESVIFALRPKYQSALFPAYLSADIRAGSKDRPITGGEALG